MDQVEKPTGDVAERLTVRMGGVIDELEDKAAELEEAVLTAELHKLRPLLDSIRRDAITKESIK